MESNHCKPFCRRPPYQSDTEGEYAEDTGNDPVQVLPWPGLSSPASYLSSNLPKIVLPPGLEPGHLLNISQIF